MKTNKDKDRLLKEVLRKSSSESLPFNFTNKMMAQINVEAQKKQKRATALNVCFLLLRNITFSPESGSILGFYFYIGLLVLGLLGLDYYLRKLKQHS